MLAWIAEVTGAREARRAGRIQSLWSGYGEVFRVALDGGVAPTAIVKWVQPPGRAEDSASDARKRRSYEVEDTFYRQFANRCDEDCRVAKLYGSRRDGDERIFVFEDLDEAGYRARHDDAQGVALDACLAWLAAFHARFLGERGEGLWEMGTYWHLATRTAELANIGDKTLRARAAALDGQLAAAKYQTLLHGDPKEANFCFTRDGRRVAAVDFQYVGRGCAMKDVAYLLYGRTDDTQAALDTYFRHLRAALTLHAEIDAIEGEWRSLYSIARLDFVRFLAGWRP